ncbi:Altered inheritance of mitochondria protein 32 [Yarrowia sp. B02]|nr:Altered inheritance of mitochondria protein 32 [Yarrowia sp. B02]
MSFRRLVRPNVNLRSLTTSSSRDYSRKAIRLSLPDLEFSTPKKTVNFCDKCPGPDIETPYTRVFPPEHEDAIDYKKSMPAAFHLRHLLISTGDRKWPKAIEKDQGSLAFEIAEKRHEFPLRSKMAKGGILVSNTTLPSVEGHEEGNGEKSGSGSAESAKSSESVSNGSTESSDSSITTSSAYLFPDNLVIKNIPHNQTEEFLETLLEENDEIRAIKLKEKFGAVDNSSDLWLVCGHSERDVRCGDIGPLILAEMDEIKPEGTQTGLISHIGGHAFAGNVLLFSGKTGQSAWFGRVRPEHIQGLVKEWKDGRIVKELYRGTFAE